MQVFDKLISKQEIKIGDIANIQDLLEGLVTKDKIVFSNMKVIKDFPFNKNSFINDYLSLLEKEFKSGYDDIKEIFNRISIKEEIFECEVGDGNWFIKYLFDINKAKKILKELEFPIQSIDTELLIEYSKIIETDGSYIEKTTSKEPVIVCHYPYISPSFFVIDGNHRVMRNYANNLQKTKAYLVSKDLMLEFLISPIFEYLVYIHNNISMIGTYMIGQISYEELLLALQPIVNSKY